MKIHLKIPVTHISDLKGEGEGYVIWQEMIENIV